MTLWGGRSCVGLEVVLGEYLVAANKGCVYLCGAQGNKGHKGLIDTVGNPKSPRARLVVAKFFNDTKKEQLRN